MRAVTILRSERGEYLVRNMVGALISMLVLGVVAAGIMGAGSFHAKVSVRSAVTSQASAVEAAFGNDLTWASSIDIQDSHQFTATVPGNNGECRVSEWKIVSGPDETTRLINTVHGYPSFTKETNPVTCEGAPGPAVKNVMIDRAAKSTAFTYANAGGRALNFTDGDLLMTAAAEPKEGVHRAAWDSVAPQIISIDTSIAAGTDTATDFTFTRAALNLDVVEAPGSWDQHFVPGGYMN